MQRIIPLASLTALLFASPVRSADLSVSPGESIQQAIALASDGDRVLVAPGTYLESIDFLGKRIEILGIGGAAATILDGSQSGQGPVVRFWSGEGPDSILRGLTITGGYSPFTGAGISGYCDDECPGGPSAVASPTIEDCIVRGNQGIGVYGNPILRRCVIDGNLSLGGGPTAVYAVGGGVRGAPRMRWCVVSRNVGGPGILFTDGGSVEDCVVAENVAGIGAGITWRGGSDTVVRRTLLVGNVATSVGPCIIASLGGAVHATDTGLRLESCTVVGNDALDCGSYACGGVYGPVELVNSIVRGNTAVQLEGVGAVTYSDVQGAWPGTGNFDLDPSFVDPSAGVLDLHLRAGSPCIDAGDPARLDPDGSRSDVGAFPFATFYARANVLPSHYMDPAWPEVPTALGGKTRWRTHLGSAFAGYPFWTLGSYSGTTPGLTLNGVTLSLNPDPYFRLGLRKPNMPPFRVSKGLLDASGTAASEFFAPSAMLAGLEGLELWHATGVIDPLDGKPAAATNATSLHIVP